MRIRVEDIRENKELAVEEEISVSNWEMDNGEVKFLDSIGLKCRANRFSKEIILNVDVSIRWMITCSRCLEDVAQKIKQSYTFTYNADNLGECIDVDKDAREEILLNFPMKLLCEQECKGICSKCGANLNRERCRCCKGG